MKLTVVKLRLNGGLFSSFTMNLTTCDILIVSLITTKVARTKQHYCQRRSKGFCFRFETAVAMATVEQHATHKMVDK